VSLNGSDKITGEDGDTAAFTVSLNAAPTSNVTLNFAVSDTTEAKLNTSSLTFTKDNWNVAQSLTVTGVDDYDYDGDVTYTLNVTVSSTDATYAALNVSSIALVNKDDTLDKPISDYIGTSSNDNYSGGNGNDVLYSGYGNDVLRGGRGDDRLYGEQNSDVLFGDDGNDKLYGGYESDELYGGTGNDELYGQEDEDRLEGGAGNDYLDGGTGGDRMIGGVGNDTYIVDNGKDVIDDQGATTDKDTVIVMATISYTLAANVENAELKDASGAASLTGNTLNNDLTGNGSKNSLDGGAGNDVLDAGAGDDTLLGGEGTDILIGGLGDDSLSGGAGDDQVDYSSVKSKLNINLTSGKASGIGTDTLTSIEDAVGGAADDVIKGNTMGNELTGGLGADQMSLGADKAVDLLIYRAVNESLAAQRDRISQFMSQQDKISLSGIDANSKVAGDQAFAFNGTTAQANAVWYRQADVDGDKKTNDLIIYGDVNGNTTADFEIGLVGVTAIAASDFVL
jgi:Ca2+-binding RTX toxin-like protein